MNSGIQSHSERVKHGIMAARALGVVWGASGQNLADHNIAVAHEHAAKLRPLIVALIGAVGEAPERLAYHMNRMDVPTARGGRWSRSTVRRVIKRLAPTLAADVAAMNATGAWTDIKNISYQEWLRREGKGGVL
ncbi:MAG: hypothetical protein RB191_11040 [Terriglobia bacterium]|nr:hypothetical protein [Terriglobia bacterium]